MFDHRFTVHTRRTSEAERFTDHEPENCQEQVANPHCDNQRLAIRRVNMDMGWVQEVYAQLWTKFDMQVIRVPHSAVTNKGRPFSGATLSCNSRNNGRLECLYKWCGPIYNPLAKFCFLKIIL